jgi:hypothetical protein
MKSEKKISTEKKVSKKSLLAGVALIATLLTVLGYSVAVDKGALTAWISVAYGVLVSVFLVAQIYGFVVSQVKYVENIEKAKLKVLEVEGLLDSSPENSTQKMGAGLVPMGCFFCGVDSGPVLTFFLWLIGAGITATICILIGSALKGRFSHEDKMVMKPLEAERGLGDE